MKGFRRTLTGRYDAIRRTLLSMHPDVVSFDIYDTLITRPFVKPTDLFTYMEEHLGMKGFRDARIKAESESRRLSDREDITIDDIYDIIPSEYRGLKKTEIQYERELVVPMRPAVDLLKEMKADGRQIVLVSDMYLPETVIEDCLKRCGIPYDRLFVSSTYGKTKHIGSLFDIVLEETGVKPDRIVHIGDNRHADVKMPKTRGIASIHVRKPIEVYLSEDPRKSRYLSRRGSCGSSMIAALDMIHLMDGSDGLSEWYEAGFRFGGPLAYAYSLFIGSNLRGGSLPMFVSRDGYNLMKVTEILFPKMRKGVYVHAQRVLSQALSDHGIRMGEIHPPSSLTYHFLYRKDIEDARHILRFLSDIFPDVPRDDDEMIGFYNDNIERIDLERKRRRTEYEDYLRGMVGEADIDLIDCTTMKYTSQRFVEEILGRKVHGIYLVSLADDGSMDHSSFHTKSSIAMGWMGINIDEFLLCSPEYPIAGWNGGPCFISAPECEVERVSNYGDITSGECDYARMMNGIFGEYRPAFDYLDVMEWTLASIDDDVCGGLMRRIKWASDPDHKVWNGIVPDARSIPTIVRKQLTDIIFRMNG